MQRYLLFAMGYHTIRGGSRDVAAQAKTLNGLFAAYCATAVHRTPLVDVRFEVLDMERREWLTEPSAIIDYADEGDALISAAVYRALGFRADVCPGEGSNGRIYGVNVSC